MVDPGVALGVALKDASGRFLKDHAPTGSLNEPEASGEAGTRDPIESSGTIEGFSRHRIESL
jgi:hypothetical protein